MRRLIPIVIIVIALAGIIVLLVAARARTPQDQAPVAEQRQLRFALTDHHGKPFSLADLGGRPALVYFGYTFCPDICPTELGFISRLLKRLGPDSERLQPLFITIDPGRDTAAVLADYVPLFHPRFIGLTGTPEAIAAAAGSVGAFFQRADVITQQPGFYLMDHSLSTFLVDGGGTVLATYDSHEPLERVVADIRQRLAALEPAP